MRDIDHGEQPSDRGQPLAALRVRTAPGVRLRRGSFPIARVAAPNAARGTFTTGC